MFVVIVGFELKASGFETLTRRSQLIAHSFLLSQFASVLTLNDQFITSFSSCSCFQTS